MGSRKPCSLSVWSILLSGNIFLQRSVKWSETVNGKLCSATKLLNKVSALVTWSSTDFVGINWRNWGVLLVAVTAFLCKLVAGCLLIAYSPPEATLILKLELHRVQNARSFPNELDCNQRCDFFHSSWNFQLYFFFFDAI